MPTTNGTESKPVITITDSSQVTIFRSLTCSACGVEHRVLFKNGKWARKPRSCPTCGNGKKR